MPYIPPEAIEQAKKIDLLTYLQTCEPHELVRISDQVYSTKTHDSLKISNGKWMWWSRRIGGKTALDYLIKVKGMPFLGAVQLLTKQAAGMPPVPAPRGHDPPKEKTLVLPPPYPHSTCVMEYLRSRGIDTVLIRSCLEAGRIYESHNQTPSGRTFVNAVFVGFDAKGIPRYASLRGVRSAFKGEAIGSDKHYAFSLPANRQAKGLHLFESAIDLLSYATLLKRTGHDWQRCNLLSLAGIYQPKKQLEESRLPAALTQYLKDYPHIRQIKLHLDNDHAGRAAAQAILTVMPEHYEVINDPPMCGKDVNNLLLEHRRRSQTRNKDAR